MSHFQVACLCCPEGLVFPKQLWTTINIEQKQHFLFQLSPEQLKRWNTSHQPRCLLGVFILWLNLEKARGCSRSWGETWSHKLREPSDSFPLTSPCLWTQLIKTPGSQQGVLNFFTSYFSIIQSNKLFWKISALCPILALKRLSSPFPLALSACAAAQSQHRAPAHSLSQLTRTSGFRACLQTKVLLL